MRRGKRAISVILAVLMTVSSLAAGAAEESSDEFGESSGLGTFLTEDTIQVDDIPEEYLEPARQTGRVERVKYRTQGSGETEESKSALVYLPAGYDESDARYNVLYLFHAAGGSLKSYLDLNQATPFQCLLDHMIENGDIAPLIVVAPTYYSSDSFLKYMPLAQQVEMVSGFPEELTEDIVPAVEGTYRTYAEATDRDGLTASRDHRAAAGFSLGGIAAWYVFLQRMYAFRWFLPISEASWDDGSGGLFGIWDSDVSAQVLYDAVREQGFTKDDFYLFVATGTDDVAFEVSTEQMKSLLAYDDLFITGENTSCSMMIGGTHVLSAIYTYLYHILPAVFVSYGSDAE